MQQDERIFQFYRHALLIVHEVRGEVAAIKLHTFDHVQLVIQGGTLFHSDNAFLADLLHRLGNDIADVDIGVGGDALIRSATPNTWWCICR